jgi:hypothetical protein
MFATVYLDHAGLTDGDGNRVDPLALAGRLFRVDPVDGRGLCLEPLRTGPLACRACDGTGRIVYRGEGL